MNYLNFSFGRIVRQLIAVGFVRVLISCAYGLLIPFNGYSMDGALPNHLSSSSFKFREDYQAYDSVYCAFTQAYSDLIRFVNSNGGSKESDALLGEFRNLAASDRWKYDSLIVGYAQMLSKTALSNLRMSVYRLVKKVQDLKYKAGKSNRNYERAPLASNNSTRSQEDSNDVDLYVPQDIMASGFSRDYVMQRTEREWMNSRGIKMKGMWYHISQDGQDVWFLNTEKNKYFKIKKDKLSSKDQQFMDDFIKECVSKGLRWRKGAYLIDTEIRELDYREHALEKINEKSILRPKDIQVVQAWEYGGLCNYGRASTVFQQENIHLIYWQTGEKGVLANGEVLKNIRMIWAGTMKYETVQNQINTVACFCNDLEFAIRLVRMRLGLFEPGDKRFDQNLPVPQPDNKGIPSNCPVAYGSGFFVTTNGYLVTNFHVVDGGNKIVALTEKGRYDLRLIGKDAKTDLALLKAEGVFKPIPFSRNRVTKLGATIFTSGFPMPSSQGFSPKVTKGIVSGEKGMNDNPMHYQIDASIQPGNSGGPVCDGHGELVAVVVSMLSGKFFLEHQGTIPQNVNYAIKKSYLDAFLESYPACAERIVDGDGSEIEFSTAVDRVRHSLVLIEVY